MRRRRCSPYPPRVKSRKALRAAQEQVLILNEGGESSFCSDCDRVGRCPGSHGRLEGLAGLALRQRDEELARLVDLNGLVPGAVAADAVPAAAGKVDAARGDVKKN